jgi:(2Fe-2S) ferredoxin
MSKSFPIPDQVIYICTGSKCKKRGGKDIGKMFRNHLKDAGLQDRVEVIRTECTDRCKFAPVMCLQPQNLWFHDVSELRARQLFQEQVLPAIQKQNPPASEA